MASFKIAHGRTLVIPALLFTFTLAFSGYYARIGVDGVHDGAMFKPAVDFANGLMPFKETFYQYGALTVILQGVALKVFGEKLLVIRLQTALFYALIVVAMWFLFTRFLAAWIAAVCCLVWVLYAGYVDHIYLPWSSVYGLFFQFVATIYVVRAYETSRGRVPALLASGIATALAGWCRQPMGLLLYPVLAFFILSVQLRTETQWRRAVADCLVFTGGAIATSLLFLIWIVKNQAEYDWYLQNYKFAYIWSSGFARAWGNPFSYYTLHLFPFGGLWTWETQSTTYAVLATLTAAAFVWMSYLLFWKHAFNVEKSGAYATMLFALASWHGFFPFFDRYHHAYWAIAPMVGVSAYVLCEMVPKNRTVKYLRNAITRVAIALILLAALFGPYLYDKAVHGQLKISDTLKYTITTKAGTLGGMLMPQAMAKELDRIADTLDRLSDVYPEKPVINACMDSIAITLARNATNFHPLFADWEIFSANKVYPHYGEQFAEYLSAIRPLVLAPLSKFKHPDYRLIEQFEYTCSYGDNMGLYAPHRPPVGTKR